MILISGLEPIFFMTNQMDFTENLTNRDNIYLGLNGDFKNKLLGQNYLLIFFKI